MDDSHRAIPVSAAALKQLFTTLKDNIRVVLLNACYSQDQAEAIVEVIDCAIGMKQEIGDEAAMAFAASFYRAVGYGHSVNDAFEQGKVALMLQGIPEETTPTLLVREGVDADALFLVDADEVDVEQPSHETPIVWSKPPLPKHRNRRPSRCASGHVAGAVPGGVGHGADAARDPPDRPVPRPARDADGHDAPSTGAGTPTRPLSRSHSRAASRTAFRSSRMRSCCK